MIYIWLAAGFGLPLLTTCMLIPFVQRRALKRGWVDAPDGDRKLHPEPTPSVGGLAIAAGAAVGVLLLASAASFAPFPITLPPTAVWAGALVMVVVGFYDDTRGLTFRKKFAIQAVVAFILLHVGYRVDLSGLPFVDSDPYNQTMHSMLISMLWIVGVINAVNLLDGVDGLAAGVALIAFSCMAFVYGLRGDFGLVLIGLLMIGPLVGFLLFNFNPASIFMGDSGSLFLGFSLAAYTLAGDAHAGASLAKIVPVVALGLPVLDTGLSIVRRMASGRSVFSPDHDHVHHRLVRRLSPRGAVLVLYVVAVLFSGAAILIALSPPSVSVAVMAVLAVLAYAGLRSLGYFGQAPAGTADAVEDESAQSESGDGVSSDDVVLQWGEQPISHSSSGAV